MGKGKGETGRFPSSEIRESGDLSDETTAKLDEALDKFKRTFNVEQKEALVS